jgi:tripartite-type tricarboxylate transporter receptor subunit TctC
MKAGQVRCLAVSTKKRSPILPDLPTLEEEGIKGYEHSLWNGIFAPAGIPPAIVTKVSADFAEVLSRPDIVVRLAALGIEPVGSNPEEFNRFFRAEMDKWAAVIKAIGTVSN